MEQSPRWKIYTDGGVYIGCLKHVEDCARVVSGMDGYTIRDGHKAIAWTEGREDQWAGESFDHVVRVVHHRRATHTD